MKLHALTLSFIFFTQNIFGAEYIVKWKNKPSAFNAISPFAQTLPNHIKLKISDKEFEVFLQKNKENIEYFEPNYPLFPFDNEFTESAQLSNEVYYHNQWALENTDNIDIDANKAWEFEKGSKDIIVAVVDTGVDYNHQDLSAAIWHNKNEIAGNGVDDDHNGFIDDDTGWNFFDNNNTPLDDYGHGTHVSGIIAGQGVVIHGIAPSVQIMPLRFMNGTSGSTIDAIKAINYAILMKANIINASWGGSGYSKSLEEAVANAGKAGIVFVAAAGNKGQDLAISKMYPAAFELPNLITVSNIRQDGDLSIKSNYGATLSHIAAPGDLIYSTILNNKYAYISGTSMAAPYVSGAVALLDSYVLLETPEAIKLKLLESSKPLSSLAGKVSSGGLLSAGNLLEHAQKNEPPKPVDFDPQELDYRFFIHKKIPAKNTRITSVIKGEDKPFNMIGKISIQYTSGKRPFIIEATKDVNMFVGRFNSEELNQEIKVNFTLNDGRNFVIQISIEE